MIYGIERLTRDVRVCLDQNMMDEALFEVGDIDTLSLEQLIRSKAVEAVARVHSVAPVHLLESGHNFGDAIHWGELESGWVLLPDDFMRLVVFEMSDWERAVTEAITPDDARYVLQRQRVKALRGTAQKPVCVLTVRPEGKSLEFYSCKSEEAYVRRGLYLPYPTIDEDGGVDICEHCYTAVVYCAAALVLTTLGEHEKATMFSEKSKTALV